MPSGSEPTRRLTSYTVRKVPSEYGKSWPNAIRGKSVASHFTGRCEAHPEAGRDDIHRAHEPADRHRRTRLQRQDRDVTQGYRVQEGQPGVDERH